MSKWWSFFDCEEIDVKDLPTYPCVYAVYLNGELGYVGSTINLAQRIRTHHIAMRGFPGYFQTPWGVFRDVSIKARRVRQYGDHLAIEARLIRRLMPKHNIMLVPGKARKHKMQRSESTCTVAGGAH